MGKGKKAKSKRIQEERLKLFEGEGEGYREKQWNGRWYVRQWNPSLNRYVVSEYSEEKFRRYKQYWYNRESEDLDAAFEDALLRD